MLTIAAAAAVHVASAEYGQRAAEGAAVQASEGLTVSGIVAAAPAPVVPAVRQEPGTASVSAGPRAFLSATSARIAEVTVDGLRLAAAGIASQQGLPGPGAPPLSTPVATATATATPGAAAPPACDKSQSRLYCVYTVGPGDTLSSIATRFGLKSSEDIANWDLLVYSNQHTITSGQDYIQAGQKLRIPAETGVIHVVISAETAAEVARRYGAASSAVVGASGAIAAGEVLSPGDEVLVRDPTRLAVPVVLRTPPEAPAPVAAAQPSPTPTPTISPTPTATATAQAAASPAAPAATATAARGTPTATARAGTPGPTATVTGRRTAFIWPVAGPLSSYFGPSHPLGIDIDLFDKPDAPIVASAAGTVVFAGGNPCCSYGYYVIVDHGNGYSTLYAHLSRFTVSAGQAVNQGALLGYGGRTGYATGNHLHFEVRYQGGIIDPLSVLP